MKGQFMIISSVIVGLMMISLGSTVAEVQSESYSPRYTSYEIRMIQEEAEKLRPGGIDPNERRKFRSMLDQLTDYSSEAEYWEEKDCFNITMERPETELEFKAPEEC